MSFTEEQVEEALRLAAANYEYSDEYDEDEDGEYGLNWGTVSEIFYSYGGQSNDEKTYNGMTIKCIEDFGGGEGSGETRYLVFEVREEGATGAHAERQYFRKDGYYASYYGTDWDGDFREVKAIQRTITFYE